MVLALGTIYKLHIINRNFNRNLRVSVFSFTVKFMPASETGTAAQPVAPVVVQTAPVGPQSPPAAR